MQRKLRIQGGTRRYDEISFLKGFSILTIVLSHLITEFMTQLPNFVRTGAAFGGTGTHVFFFCSGFGLYLSYLNHSTGYMEFLKKRFLKVYFPYIFVVLIIFLIPGYPVYGNRVTALLSHTFLFKMFSAVYDESFGPYWFVSAIFQFYFAFIPLCRLKEKAGRKVFLAACFAMSALWWIFTGLTGLNAIRPIGSFFLQYLWEFALGMVIADRLYHGGSLKFDSAILVAAAVIGMILAGILATSADYLKAFNDVPAVLGYGSLALLVYQINPIKKAGIWFGKISYELYLVHYLIFKMLYLIVNPEGLLLQILLGVLGIAASIFLAYVYHNVIHRGRKSPGRNQS